MALNTFWGNSDCFWTLQWTLDDLFSLSSRSSELLLHLPCVSGSVPDCYNLLRFSCALLALRCGGRRRPWHGQPGVLLGTLGTHERGGGQQQCSVCVRTAGGCFLLLHRQASCGFQTTTTRTGTKLKFCLLLESEMFSIEASYCGKHA